MFTTNIFSRFCSCQVRIIVISILSFLLLLAASGCHPNTSGYTSRIPPNIFTNTPSFIKTKAVASNTKELIKTSDILTNSKTKTETIQSLSVQDPWLVYISKSAVGAAITVVNQDGTGQIVLNEPGVTPNTIAAACNSGDTFMPEESSSNRMVKFYGEIYLIHPPNSLNVYRPNLSYCRNMDYSGDAKVGLFANIQNSGPSDQPEIIIYELPTAKVRNRIPLLECSEQGKCNSEDNAWEIKWSPDGRYLAFPAIKGGPSTDLFVYDNRDGQIRQLTSNPDSVSQLWWSPDGSWVILGIASNSNPPATSSVWAVSANGSRSKLLYSLDHPAPQDIIQWDNHGRFLASDYSLSTVVNDPPKNIRLVTLSGNSQLLFDGTFGWAAVGEDFDVVMIYAIWNNQYKTGNYLITISPLSVRYLTSEQLNLVWNDELDLFVATMDGACETDPDKVKAYDKFGNKLCVTLPNPAVVTTFPSPDGKWTAFLNEGVLRLESADQSKNEVLDESATQIIWCPDSNGFFYASRKILYFVSLPDFVRNIVDAHLLWDKITYQWV
jgi:WD40 repeat protein